MKDRDYYINKYLQMGVEYLNVDLTCIVPKLVNEMMIELEAISSLQSTRSCDGCFYDKGGRYIIDTSCLDCSRGYPDMYEAKNKTLHQVTKMTLEQAKELFKDCKIDFVIEKLYQYFTEPYTKG